MNDTEKNHRLAVVIGRFQPPHLGHLALIAHAAEMASRVVVVLGSSRCARSARNPFSDGEREAMLNAMIEAVAPHLGARVLTARVRDYFDDRRWAAEIARAVHAAIGCDDDGGVALVGHAKDATSYYLELFPAWTYLPVSCESDTAAADIRRLMFSVEDGEGRWPLIDERVARPVCQLLSAFTKTSEYTRLLAEWRHLEEDKRRWQAAPYPVLLVTADALVTCLDHVLLIRRGGPLGEGLWAIPGGFVEQYEWTRHAAERELREETGLGLSASYLEAFYRARHVFEFPFRSQRGRVITHAYYYALDAERLPMVQAGDDAREARWIPIAALADMAERLFEDHLCIIEHFLATRIT